MDGAGGGGIRLTGAKPIDFIDRVIGWRLLAGWMVLIFALSSIPNRIVADEPSPFPFDKVAHAVEFAVLAFIITWMVRRQWGSVALAIALGVVLSSLYGITDEFHQRFVPGRDAGLPDLAADVVGAVIGAVGAGAVVLRRGAVGGER